jgi:hypothetical protein
MPSNEGIDMAKMAITVFVVIMVISVVVGIAMFGYDKVNKGKQVLEQKSSSVEEAQFKAINENILTGSSLLAQIQQDYSGDAVILVSAYGERVPMGTAAATYNNFGIQQDGVVCTPGTVKTCAVSLDTSGRFYINSAANVGTSVKNGYRNTAIALMNDKANTSAPLATYVPDTVKYYCRLLYDENGSRIGYVATAIE